MKSKTILIQEICQMICAIAILINFVIYDRFQPIYIIILILMRIALSVEKSNVKKENREKHGK